MENKEIKVSVVIPVYNTEKYVREAVESIMNQTLQELEIIIINDGSTDNSCLLYTSPLQHPTIKSKMKANTDTLQKQEEEKPFQYRSYGKEMCIRDSWKPCC